MTFKELIDKRHREIENGTSDLFSWNEVCESIGYFDERT